MAALGNGGGEQTSRPLILHVSGDFPDPVEPFKTQAIRNLLDLTRDRFDHHVLSINRVSSSPFRTARELVAPTSLRVEAEEFEYGKALRYWAPSKGIRHRTKLDQLGDWIASYISSLDEKPELIIGHKLAIEGIAVRRASQLTAIPYGLSIQGDTDTKVLDARRDLAGTLGEVLHGSSVTFPFAPWAWDRVTARLGNPSMQPIMLPCATELDEPCAPVAGGSGLLSVFHLKSYRRKNLAGMRQAIRLLAQENEPPKLKIIGGGEEHERARCEAIIADTPAIRLEGSKNRGEVRAAMNKAVAFVLPSLRESFGLVFVEALFAGLPIIYPRGSSVDGYFDNAPFALPVDARDPQSIAEAMQHALAHETEMKQALALWQRSDESLRFQRDHIAQQFANGLDQARSGVRRDAISNP